MKITLISTYELGRQPFGLASPAAWLREAGHDVACLDLAVEQLHQPSIIDSELICFFIPMHTATRMAIAALPRIRSLNESAPLCFYGLYAPMNEPLLRRLGASAVLGGEYEASLLSLANRLHSGNETPQAQVEPVISLDRLPFRQLDRRNLPPLAEYSYIRLPDGSHRVTGYTEATRGCKHRCRHCPIVPVYGGQFRIVPREIVLADIAQQVSAGAQHITFGDPDFCNGPGHARRIVEELHGRWPELSYDVTIKIEHLLDHQTLLPVLAQTGCVLVTTAVESVDPLILEFLDKRHTPAEFARAVELCRDAGLALNPTFVTFTPWTTRQGYLEVLRAIADLDLVEAVSPIQYAIRLLLPRGSRLLELPQTQQVIGEFDDDALAYRWRHPDSAMDALHAELLRRVPAWHAAGLDRSAIYDRVWRAAATTNGTEFLPSPRRPHAVGTSVPYMSEPWYC